MSFSMPELIRKKRDGFQLTQEEIKFFIDSVVSGKIQDCQIGAMLMAMFFNQLSIREMVDLTKTMASSGEMLSFKKFRKEILVDKHSTGGVGDKVSLILAPALAVYGLKVPMISGRSLGYTGGTLDKLESIPGFQINLSFDEMNQCLETVGCFICGASKSFVPADAVLYQIRDITATVENSSLILASILSKKAAEGIGILVLDVKFGRGTAIKTQEEAAKIAENMLKIGENLNLKTHAVLSEMNVPLGKFVGNALEVVESIMCMRNILDNEVTELVRILGAIILKATGKAENLQEGKSMIQKALTNKEALNLFQNMLILQGVSEKNAKELCNGDYWKVLPKAHCITRLRSPKKGIVADIDAIKIGKACWYLGGGRQKAGDQIDHSVGVILLKKIGDEVEENEPWIEIHHFKKPLELTVENLIFTSLVVEKNPKNFSCDLKTVIFT